MKIKEYYESEHLKRGSEHNQMVFEPEDIVTYVDPKVLKLMDDVDALLNNADGLIAETNASGKLNVESINKASILEHNLHQSLFVSHRLNEEVESLHTKMLRASSERETVPAVTMLNLLSS